MSYYYYLKLSTSDKWCSFRSHNTWQEQLPVRQHVTDSAAFWSHIMWQVAQLGVTHYVTGRAAFSHTTRDRWRSLRSHTTWQVAQLPVTQHVTGAAASAHTTRNRWHSFHSHTTWQVAQLPVTHHVTGQAASGHTTCDRWHSFRSHNTWQVAQLPVTQRLIQTKLTWHQKEQFCLYATVYCSTVYTVRLSYQFPTGFIHRSFEILSVIF